MVFSFERSKCWKRSERHVLCALKILQQLSTLRSTLFHPTLMLKSTGKGVSSICAKLSLYSSSHQFKYLEYFVRLKQKLLWDGWSSDVVFN